MKSILLNLDPQKWLDTLESLTFQLQNHKKPLKMSKLVCLEKFAKKLFHIKLIRKAWRKMEKEPRTFHFAKVIHLSYHLKSLCENFVVQKLISLNFYLWKLKFWPNLRAKIWDLMNFRLTKWAKEHKFQFWTSWFSKVRV